MKALIYEGPNSVAVRSVAEPSPQPDCTLVRPTYSGICGSDIGIYLGTHPRAAAPLVLGHEFFGVVAQDSRRFDAGERVAAFPLLSCGACLACTTGNSHVCNSLRLLGIDVDGGAAATTLVGDEMLFRIPEGVSDLAAAMIEPLAVIIRTMHRANLSAFDTAAVVGAGPIGILTGLVLKHLGATGVFISDIMPRRLEVAESLGMTAVDSRVDQLADVVRSHTDGEGADVVFECSGAEQSSLDMTEVARVGGTICLTAVHKAPHAVDLRTLNFREQTLVGSRVYTKREFGQAVALTKSLGPDLERIVSHVLPLSEAAGFFDLITDPDAGAVKVVIDCQAE